MQTIKATIQYIDVFGRASILTEDNQPLLMHCKNPEDYLKGDEIYLTRKDGLRRVTDWQMGGLVHVLR